MTTKLRVALVLIGMAGMLSTMEVARGQSTQARASVPVQRAAGKSDADIEADIRRRFASSKSKDENFTVKVRNGIATIEGKTSVPQRKGSATRMARTGGARQVSNLIQVSDAAKRTAAQAFAKRRVQITRSERP